ncbi:hypothetical protein ACGTRS_11025 [Burkholderia semiarida]|uniref:Uncharacterized protein n=1 Tax=Burkholderia semiarida TaxID=2843303 RepID=A0ABW7L1T6_9BURK
MSYIIQNVHGPAPLGVGERKWGDATEIDFGAMTSCIALVEQTPGQPTLVRGIHLSIVSPDGTNVYDPAADVAGQVETIMQQQGNMRACLGRIDLWQASTSQELQDFFVALMMSLDMTEWVQCRSTVSALRAGTAGRPGRPGRPQLFSRQHQQKSSFRPRRRVSRMSPFQLTRQHARRTEPHFRRRQPWQSKQLQSIRSSSAPGRPASR